MFKALRRSSILLCLCIAALLLAGGCASRMAPPALHQYVSVIDAGSSGSRIYLYKKTLRPGEKLSVETLLDWRPRTRNALSDFQSHPDDVGRQAIAPLLEQLDERLNALGVTKDQVPVNILGTAGMRQVEARDPVAAQQIYANARQMIQAANFPLAQVGTLSGQDEGVYAWVDANFLTNRLNAGSKTLGIIEVGGASSQIVYQADASSLSNLREISTQGMTYHLVSRSFFGLGQDEARRSMITRGGGESGSGARRCYPQGSTPVQPSSYDVAVAGLSISSGDYDYGSCSALYDQVLAAQDVRSALTDGFSRTDFLATASVFYAARDWGIAQQPGQLPQTVEHACSGTQAWEKSIKPGHGSGVYAQNACANGTFISRLLFGPVGLRVEPEQLSAARQVHGQTLTWTRGLAMIERP